MSTKRKYDKEKNNESDLKDIKNKLENLKNKTEVIDGKNENNKKNVDPFNDLKIHILNILDETRKCIREKDEIQNIHGNNIEVIKRSNIIYNNMKNLETYFTKFDEILKKQLKQRYTFTKDELLDKNETYELLKKQFFECKKISNYNQIKDVCMVNFSEYKNKAKLETKVTDNNIHDEDDLIIINQWKERDKKFNDEILKIGDTIDKIGANVDIIAEKANEQNEIIINVHDQTDKTQDNVKEINVEIKLAMKKHSHATWCLRISLAIIFVVLVLITLNVISNRLLKRM
ncbi:hypothetical protein YYC_02926 [Plasmodium yoelii 17X]|uniref:t-SNARE coiled-coil homology domain-containing protein n=3 Tax=Plasmodium yoelii TaxID=5861 RepID=A0AAF0B0S1_PLAYO|nr:conserved Plasmodium protein, unknown function [Plasmodium yoelii]ETB59442.1 hypothetical protein YYC_02926 [Plasmodium yoelii 17X]WBY58167.1 hypothetical protein Py17XNL_001002409 [Plasmodium yoelii yoelii]CDU85204.1 conserved Plasmodium protein, unknown function [Plasmodium yoelii]VTZ79099.1 conserved Plasmodium protein, unknown function [Plasmodium yoelii]|eukprot:XP_728506.2 conserved Plasmodium protein, unknown function [Plasmodium yoelii]